MKLYTAVCPTCGNEHPLRGWAPTNTPFVQPQCNLCGNPVIVFGPPRAPLPTDASHHLRPAGTAVPPIDDAFEFPALTGTAW